MNMTIEINFEILDNYVTQELLNFSLVNPIDEIVEINEEKYLYKLLGLIFGVFIIGMEFMVCVMVMAFKNEMRKDNHRLRSYEGRVIQRIEREENHIRIIFDKGSMDIRGHKGISFE